MILQRRGLKEGGLANHSYMYNDTVEKRAERGRVGQSLTCRTERGRVGQSLT